MAPSASSGYHRLTDSSEHQGSSSPPPRPGRSPRDSPPLAPSTQYPPSRISPHAAASAMAADSQPDADSDVFDRTLTATELMIPLEDLPGSPSTMWSQSPEMRDAKTLTSPRAKSDRGSVGSTRDSDGMESIISLLDVGGPASVVVVTDERTKASHKYLVLQVTPILLIAVVGSMVSGWLFDSVQTWPAFHQVTELFILVSILMNLKGNLEVNLSSRLSTLANLGELDDRMGRLTAVLGNLLLLLFQTLTVGFVAGVLASTLGFVFSGWDAKPVESPTAAADAIPIGNLQKTMLIIVTSMLTSFVGSLLIGVLSCVAIYASHRTGIDPDNVAIPLTSSFGDMTTVLLLSRFAQGLFQLRSIPVLFVLFFLLLGLLAATSYLARRNRRVSGLMGAGWPPLVFALIMTSLAGLLVKSHVIKFHALAVLLPVFNGTIGNVCTIFASRISTHLHAGTEESYRPVMVMLFLINLPVHWIFLLFVNVLHLAHGILTWKLWLLYTIACLCIVFLMLALAKALTLLIWQWNYDPDNYTNPFLTSISDFSGTLGLIMVFYILQHM